MDIAFLGTPTTLSRMEKINKANYISKYVAKSTIAHNLQFMDFLFFYVAHFGSIFFLFDCLSIMTN
jgi:hypothetical protein